MIALTNGQILTMNDEVIKRGTVLIEGKQIKAVGEDISIPEQAEEIDVQGKIVIPGLIDAHTHLGIAEEGIGWEGRDTNEMTDPINPHLRAIDGVNPEDEGFVDAYQAGVTTVMVAPGSANVLGGMCSVLKTYGRTVDEMMVKEKVGVKGALGENPKRVYNEQNKPPSTRMAVSALFRKTLMEAEDYLSKKENREDFFDRDIKLEVLAEVITGEIPIKLHAHRADDIMTGLRIAREFGINLTLEHATEGHKIAKELAEADVPVIVGPTMTSRSKVELKDRTFSTPAVLTEAGLKVAIMSDHPATPVNNLLIYAALAVKAGMDKQEALKAVTINPAKVLEIDDKVGSIEPGKDADLVVLDGEPFNIATEVEKVFIEGKEVD